MNTKWNTLLETINNSKYLFHISFSVQHSEPKKSYDIRIVALSASGLGSGCGVNLSAADWLRPSQLCLVQAGRGARCPVCEATGCERTSVGVVPGLSQ